jgi:outer membrane protein TolC
MPPPPESEVARLRRELAEAHHQIVGYLQDRADLRNRIKDLSGTKPQHLPVSLAGVAVCAGVPQSVAARLFKVWPSSVSRHLSRTKKR